MKQLLKKPNIIASINIVQFSKRILLIHKVKDFMYEYKKLNMF